MNDKLKCVAIVRTSNAPEEIEINSEGLVLNKNFASIWGHQIIKFDLEEYKHHYNESDIESEYDILDQHVRLRSLPATGVRDRRKRSSGCFHAMVGQMQGCGEMNKRLFLFFT